MTKILVTGGAGFIGSNLVEALVKKGEQVVVVDNLSFGNLKNLPLFVKFYQVDIRDFDSLKEVFEKEKPEVIFHLAANIDLRKSVSEPIMDAEHNIIGSLNLLELSRLYNIKKFISSSSGAVYGDIEIPNKEEQEVKPVAPYSISKLTIEKYLDFYEKTYGLKYAALRYANVYGPKQNSKGEAGVISIFLDKMLRGEQPTIFGTGLATRDYVYVGDVVKANLLAWEKGQGIYNVSTCKETNVIDIFHMLNSFFDNKFSRNHVGGKPGEIIRACLSNEKLKALGWQPEISLEQGIRRTYDWFKNR
ncbi:MAG: NAD-dependent epimerase/dehydratase family protein [Candidatus Pacearchaeota archaeon]|nr:NAD-dependent epimerase/dehydratase family protein [Candidatus Pacearchaeota archaeon]